MWLLNQERSGNGISSTYTTDMDLSEAREWDEDDWESIEESLLGMDEEDNEG